MIFNHAWPLHGSPRWKLKIWKLRLTWEQRMRGAFRIFIDENMRRRDGRESRRGHSTYFISPHMPVGRSKLASDGQQSGSLVSLLTQRQRHTWPWTARVNRGHLFCEPQWLSGSGMISKETNNKGYFQPRQCHKQLSAVLNWRRRRRVVDWAGGLGRGWGGVHRASYIWTLHKRRDSRDRTLINFKVLLTSPTISGAPKTGLVSRSMLKSSLGGLLLRVGIIWYLISQFNFDSEVLNSINYDFSKI